MCQLSFNDLPSAVDQLLKENQEIKKLLQTLINGNSGADAEPEIMNTEQAAQFLNKPKGSIYNLVSSGEMPHSKKGGSLFFLRSELIEWVADGKKKTNNEHRADAEGEAIGAFKN